MLDDWKGSQNGSQMSILAGALAGAPECWQIIQRVTKDAMTTQGPVIHFSRMVDRRSPSPLGCCRFVSEVDNAESVDLRDEQGSDPRTRLTSQTDPTAHKRTGDGPGDEPPS